jgi:mRNA-degrading endonuclease RelE of RelBE toxin-antitoxin system
MTTLVLDASATALRRSARSGVYRIIYEIDDNGRLVIVYRIEHRATAYRPR